MLMEESKGSCSNIDSSSRVWRKVWKLKGPKVVSSFFLWKACNNILGFLATKTNLHKRGITQDPLCPICGLVPETVEHSLWTCPAAKDV